MPELPEVETMARELRPLVTGRALTGFWCSRLSVLGGADPEILRASLVGQRIAGVRRRAKIVLVDFDDGSSLSFAPRMTGRFALVRAGEGPLRHERAGLDLSDGSSLRWLDSRTFGRLAYHPAWPRGDGPWPPALAGLGPEPLDPGNGPEVLAAGAARHPRTAIKALLLDQAVLAGVGNIYADESLWRARLAPTRPGGSLSTDEIGRLWTGVTEVLAEAVEHRGSTVRDYASLGGAGSMASRLAAYGRGGKPCRRCGTALSRSRVAGRSSVWCPVCQPE